MTAERQKELIYINKVLAVLTVVLALIAGYLFADKQAWLKAASQPVEVVVPQTREFTDVVVPLPTPQKSSPTSVASALTTLQDRHNFIPTQLTEEQLSELLWAAQGQITSWGQRTATSYKAVYPVNITVILKKPVNDSLPAGVYVYNSADHSLQQLSENISQMSEDIAIESFQSAPINLALSADTSLYSQEVGPEYVNLVFAEAGAIQQNIQLQATALELGTTTLYRLKEDAHKQYFSIPQNETIIMGMPIGIPVHQ